MLKLFVVVFSIFGGSGSTPQFGTSAILREKTACLKLANDLRVDFKNGVVNAPHTKIMVRCYDLNAGELNNYKAGIQKNVSTTETIYQLTLAVQLAHNEFIFVSPSFELTDLRKCQAKRERDALDTRTNKTDEDVTVVNSWYNCVEVDKGDQLELSEIFKAIK